jgi:hypothetical protein
MPSPISQCGGCCNSFLPPKPLTFYASNKAIRDNVNSNFSGTRYPQQAPCGYATRDGMQRNAFLPGGPSSSQQVGFVSFLGWQSPVVPAPPNMASGNLSLAEIARRRV